MPLPLVEPVFKAGSLKSANCKESQLPPPEAVACKLFALEGALGLLSLNLFLKQLLLLSFYFPFSLLLVAHVLADLLFVHPNCAHTVAARPQVPPPVLPPEPLIFLE